jgi:hypothetical protein
MSPSFYITTPANPLQQANMSSPSSVSPLPFLSSLQFILTLFHTQIISLQTLHYLTLTLLLPPLLTYFSSPDPLLYSGGANTVGHILDWRELAGRSTVISSKAVGLVDLDFGIDSKRGWVIGGCWLIASAIE